MTQTSIYNNNNNNKNLVKTIDIVIDIDYQWSSRHDYPINLRMHNKLQRLDALSKGLSGIIQLLNDRVISNDWERANGDAAITNGMQMDQSSAE